MNRLVRLILLLVLELSLGCATTGTSSLRTEGSEAKPVPNQELVPRSFDSVWDGLVRELSKSFFVINNIDKASRIINVSFSTDHPEEYIDCGTSYRTYDRGSEHIEYEYPVAQSSSFKLAEKTGPLKNLPVTYYIDRKTSLEGRINIYVAPQGDSTIVSVNCKYIFVVNVRGSWTVEDAFGSVTNRGNVDPSSNSIDFTTNQKGTAEWGSTGNLRQELTCQSSGRLETVILDMTR